MYFERLCPVNRFRGMMREGETYEEYRERQKQYRKEQEAYLKKIGVELVWPDGKDPYSDWDTE